MADEEQSAATDEKKSPSVQPQNIYLKDVSFETPNSPEIFTAKWEPQVEILMDNSCDDLGDDYYEVVLSFTITIKIGDQIAYLAEVHQAGIFVIKGLPADELHRTQNVFCLRFLHPYAISTILDLVTKGGFPQFLMPPVNFNKRYIDNFENPEQIAASKNS